ncbi:Hsp33 family molecular chaperone HslO [Fodinicurvata halophila]|uniref:Hsp33 family molecular chaperone HslO n=1 Tax=Fodinicurvata halophila TaxID=1419723 RepID=UPI00363E9CDA
MTRKRWPSCRKRTATCHRISRAGWAKATWPSPSTRASTASATREWWSFRVRGWRIPAPLFPPVATDQCRYPGGRIPDRQRLARGALLIERIPDSATGDVFEISDEDWRHSLILMSSCTEEELLAPELSAERLIYRLFHEDGVRVFEPKSFDATCRCSREKVVNVLKSLPSEQIRELSYEDGSVSMKCEFCSTNYHFSEAELEALFREATDQQDNG